MRVRQLDTNGDMTFGLSAANFLINSPQGVAQCINTRLGLIKGEWFLDTKEGTDWGGKILGRQPKAGYDAEIRRVILGTQGVSQITAYSSDLTNRALTINATVMTDYSAQALVLSAAFGRGTLPVAPVTGFPTGSSPSLALLDFTFILDQSVLG